MKGMQQRFTEHTTCSKHSVTKPWKKHRSVGGFFNKKKKNK
jgi:hypothetical protein